MTIKKSSHPGLKITFRVMFALTTLAIMAYIFFLSAETAVQSSKTSSGLIEKIADTFVPSYKDMPAEEQTRYISSLQDIVRKLAHFVIFGALGTSVAGFVATFKGKFWLKVLFCQLFCSAYAATDEYHQTFSEGRSCQLSDIALDSLGSFLGIIFVLFTVFLFVRRKEKGGDKVRKRQLKKQVEAFENKLIEADNYIKELTDLVADKDNEIRTLNQKIKELNEIRETFEKTQNNAEISCSEPFEGKNEDIREEEKKLVSSEYHDFDFAQGVEPQNNDDIETYAVKAISRIVTESVKIGCVLASSNNENKKELLNLSLGRTEVAKNEISALISSSLEPDLVKASIDKECALVMEYYQSILAQL